jgi:hypothetical protein
MSHGGNRAHLTATDLPPLVRAAAESAAAHGFEQSCPSAHRPPVHDGRPDTARLHWLRHPGLLATELPLTPSAVTIVGRRVPGLAGSGR